MKEHLIHKVLDWLLLFISSIILLSFNNCSSQMELTHKENVEMLKIDSMNIKKRYLEYPLIIYDYYVFTPVPCTPESNYPRMKTDIKLESLELLERNNEKIPAELIGGNEQITSKIIYTKNIRSYLTSRPQHIYQPTPKAYKFG